MMHRSTVQNKAGVRREVGLHKTEGASDFKDMASRLNHSAWDVKIVTVTNRAIFGHNSALGNFGVKGFLRLIACLFKEKLFSLSHGCTVSLKQVF